MTTIAYRDGVLAADTLQTSGSVRVGLTVKIDRRDDGTMVAACGDAAYAHKFRAWVMAGEQGDAPLPQRENGNDEGSGIIFRPDGTVVRCEAGGLFTMTGPHHAFGSGREFALGVMALGMGALEGIKAAMAHCIYTGGEVTVLRH